MPMNRLRAATLIVNSRIVAIRGESGLSSPNGMSTTGEVVRVLRDAILQGKLRQGERLSELTLAPTLRVSKGSVREALLLLAGDRLVEHRPRYGFFVAQLEPRDIQELYEVRLAIESAAGDLMITKGDVSVADVLDRRLNDLGKAVLDDDWNAVADADLQFHRTFVSGAENSRLDRVMDLLLYETRICMAKFEGTYERPTDLLDEHVGITEALRSQDTDLLLKLQRRHMEGAVRRLCR